MKIEAKINQDSLEGEQFGKTCSTDKNLNIKWQYLA